MIILLSLQVIPLVDSLILKSIQIMFRPYNVPCHTSLAFMVNFNIKYIGRNLSFAFEVESLFDMHFITFLYITNYTIEIL
jgi:hypothetical protein